MKRFLALAFISVTVFSLLLVPEVHASARHYLDSMADGAVNWALPMALLLLLLAVALNQQLEALNYRWLEWSLVHRKMNISYLPVRVRYVRIPYLLVLAYSMPHLVWIEEVIFRSGTETWMRGLLWGGVAFGLVHLLLCVSVRMALCNTVLGISLVAVYFFAGLWGSTLVHTTCNLAFMMWVAWSELGVGAVVARLVAHPKFIAQFPTIRSWATRVRPWFTAPART